MEKLKNPIETIVIRMKLRIRLSTTYHGLPAILLKYKKPRFFLFAFCILLVANIRVLQLALFMHTSPSTFLMDVAELMFQHKYLFHI